MPQPVPAPPTGPDGVHDDQITFPATEMAEHLLALVQADSTTSLTGEVNSGALAGFFVTRAGRRYYVRVEQIL